MKIDWQDYITLILFLCCVISILVNNVYIKWSFIGVELLVLFISYIVDKINTIKEKKKHDNNN